jgi:hypothetical protein
MYTIMPFDEIVAHISHQEEDTIGNNPPNQVSDQNMNDGGSLILINCFLIGHEKGYFLCT